MPDHILPGQAIRIPALETTLSNLHVTDTPLGYIQGIETSLAVLSSSDNSIDTLSRSDASIDNLSSTKTSNIPIVNLPEVPFRIIFNYLSVDELETLSEVSLHFYNLLLHLFKLNLILPTEKKVGSNKPVLRIVCLVEDESPFCQNQEQLNKEIQCNQILLFLNLTKLREVKLITSDPSRATLYEPIIFRETVFLDIFGRLQDLDKLSKIRKLEMAVNERSVPNGVFKVLKKMPNLRDLNLHIFVPEVMPTTRGRTRQTYSLIDLFGAIVDVPSVTNLTLKIIKAPISGLCVTLINDNIESFRLEADESFEEGSRIEFKKLKRFECKALSKYGTGTSKKSIATEQSLIRDFKLENKMIWSHFQSQIEYIYLKYKYDFEQRLTFYNGVDIHDISPHLTYTQYLDELAPRLYDQFVSRHKMLELQETVMSLKDFRKIVFNNEIMGDNDNYWQKHSLDYVNVDGNEHENVEEEENDSDVDGDSDDSLSLFDIYNNEQWDAIEVDEDDDEGNYDNPDCNMM